MPLKIKTKLLQDSKYNTSQYLNSIRNQLKAFNLFDSSKKNLSNYYFFINTKNKISVYLVNAWGDLQVYNKGNNKYESCSSMQHEIFFSICDPLLDDSDSYIKEQISHSEQVLLHESAGKYLETNFTFTKAENSHTLNNSELDLSQLFIKYLPVNYFINHYTVGESFYTVKYTGDFKDVHTWVDLLITDYIVGTIFTNSRTCTTRVAEYLTQNNINPNNIVQILK